MTPAGTNGHERLIDLRSDTVTRPTPAMREAMANAEVGDDQYGEDPTVNRLEEMSARLLGKEAAVFGRPGLSDVQRVWEQVPKVSGQGHFSHRLAFDGSQKLWITSGDRQKFDPAQDMAGNLGKILRLNDDGTVPSDNPFVAPRIHAGAFEIQLVGDGEI